MKHKYIKRIVIETENEDVPSPTFSRFNEHEEMVFNDYYHLPRVVSSKATIEDIDLNHWTVKFEYAYKERFKKVADLVGEDMAQQVLEALGE